jgi:hypothetical protein
VTLDPTGQLSGDPSDVSSDVHPRCPQCAALVRPGSQWCTLCYADLRPRAAVPAPTSSAPTSSAVGVEPFDPLTAPLALLERGEAAPGAVTAAPAADPAAAPKPSAGWPCARCGATVALDETSCTSCGAGFLEGTLSDDPVLNRLGRGPVSNQVKLFIMVGGSAGLLLLGLGIMYLFGTIF